MNNDNKGVIIAFLIGVIVILVVWDIQNHSSEENVYTLDSANGGLTIVIIGNYNTVSNIGVEYIPAEQEDSNEDHVQP